MSHGNGIRDYSFHSFGAQFIRVLADPDLYTVKVDKAVSVMDIGKALNWKTAINQIMGGMIFGIGMASWRAAYMTPLARGWLPDLPITPEKLMG